MVWQFLTKLNIMLPYDPAIALFDIYQKKLKTYVHTETCRRMFTAALFTNAKMWTQTRCPLVGERINKWCYIQAMKYHSALMILEMSCKTMKRQGGPLNGYYSVEEANQKRLHSV